MRRKVSGVNMVNGSLQSLITSIVVTSLIAATNQKESMPASATTKVRTPTQGHFWVLDPQFGNNGVVNLAIPGILWSYKVFTESNSQITVLACYLVITRTSSKSPCSISRLSSSGAVISATSELYTGNEVDTAVAQSGGRLLVVGNPGLLRITQDQKLDALFDVNGYVQLANILGPGLGPRTLVHAVDESDNIIVARITLSGTTRLGRLTPNGSVDNTFTPITVSTNLVAQAAYPLNDSRIVLVGTAVPQSGQCNGRVISLTGEVLGPIYDLSFSQGINCQFSNFISTIDHAVAWTDGIIPYPVYKSQATSGLDLNYGVNGRVLVTLPNVLNITSAGGFTALAVGPISTTLMAQLVGPSSLTQTLSKVEILVTRLLVNGKYDLSFGSGGQLIIDQALGLNTPIHIFSLAPDRMMIVGEETGAVKLIQLRELTVASQMYLPLAFRLS